MKTFTNDNWNGVLAEPSLTYRLLFLLFEQLDIQIYRCFSQENRKMEVLHVRKSFINFRQYICPFFQLKYFFRLPLQHNCQLKLTEYWLSNTFQDLNLLLDFSLTNAVQWKVSFFFLYRNPLATSIFYIINIKKKSFPLVS